MTQTQAWLEGRFLSEERLEELRDQAGAFTVGQCWDDALQCIIVTMYPPHDFQFIPSVMQDPEFTCRVCGAGHSKHHALELAKTQVPQ